jgi:hypothetical protein
LFRKWAIEHYREDTELEASFANLLEEHAIQNNELLIRVSKQPQLRDTFLAFTETDAEDYIGQSTIHSKRTLTVAMKNYREICIKERELSQKIGKITGKEIQNRDRPPIK